jgi:hypothetical protein
MSLIQQLWHLLNFVAPAIATACLAAALAKLAWRRELAAASWLGLAGWAAASGIGALSASVVVVGRDGSMAGYAALVLTVALTIWVAGFRPWRRHTG